MCRLLIGFIVIFFLTINLTKTAFASLYINEIYPAPATDEYEWVEFYNQASISADLSDYIFDDDPDFDSDSGNGIKIPLLGILGQNSACYWKLSNYLNNSGDKPTLFQNNGTLIDTFTYSTTKMGKSYSRIPDGGNWQIDLVDPTKTAVDCLTLVPTVTPTLQLTPTANPTATPTPTQTSTPTPTIIPISYDNIYLSELYSYPDSGENEWVEIYNNNDFSINLTNWYLGDIENGGSSPKLINLIIETKSYAVFDLTSSMFNNTGDSVRLLDFNKSLKDSFEYTGGEKGKSWGRAAFDSDEFCLQEPSKNTQNSGCLNIDASIVPTPTILNYSKSITNPQTPTLTKALISKTLINRPLPISLQKPATSLPQILGEKTEFSSSKNKQKTLAKTFSFIAFTNSLLTIGSILLKIKVHETLGLFS